MKLVGIFLSSNDYVKEVVEQLLITQKKTFER